MTVAHELARYALEMNYNSLPEEVVLKVKQQILDSLGCSIGGYSSPASLMVQEVVDDLGCRGESTIIGSGKKTSCVHATLVNGVMLRYLDYMDTFVMEIPGGVPPGNHSGGHQCEVIPGALAVAEKQHSNGKDFIAAVVAGYEIGCRFALGEKNKNMEQRGWNVDTRAGMVMPLVAGKLLGLTAEQMENAVGISGSQSPVLGILDAPGEEYTMAKNLRFPIPASEGIMAALMAGKGFTGPRRMFEGNRGLLQQLFQREYDVDKLVGGGKEFNILKVQVKPYCADNETQGHITATIDLVKEHNIKPEDIARIRLWVPSRSLEHTGDPAKKYPTNKETADHSSYYLTAIGIIDKVVGPGQFTKEKLEDPMVRQLIDRVTIAVDPSLEHTVVGGRAEITIAGGAVYTRQVDYFKGHYKNPMKDEELQEKFRGMASAYFDDETVRGLIGTIYDLEKLNDVGRLMARLTFPRKA